MSDITHPSREAFEPQLFNVLTEFLRSGIEEAADLIRDANSDPASGYELDGITRHIASLRIDNTGRLAVRTFGGDLFLYRVELKEL